MARFSAIAEGALQAARSAGSAASGQRAAALPPEEPEARGAMAEPRQAEQAWGVVAQPRGQPGARGAMAGPQQAEEAWAAVAAPGELHAAAGPQPEAWDVEELPRAAARGEAQELREEAQDAAAPLRAVLLLAGLPSVPLSTVPWACHRGRLRRPGPAPSPTADFAHARQRRQIASP